VNRNLSFALLLPLAVSATAPRVLVDAADRWEGTWSLGSWSCDSSGPARRLAATGYDADLAPGALTLPLAEATLALPPAGDWSIQVLRDSTLEIPGTTWERAPAWAVGPIRPVPAPASTPPAWTVVNTPGARLLRLAIPWGELGSEGLRLSRSLRVVVTYRGTGTSALPRTTRMSVANPSGSSRFGTLPASTPLVAARSLGRDASVVPDGNQSVIVTLRASSVGDLSQDGIVSITGSQIRTLLGSVGGIEFSRIAVGGKAQGRIALVSDSALPSGTLETIPIRRIDLNGDGVFDLQDRIEFYAHGPSYWTPDTALRSDLFGLSVHPWDMSRRYLVRLDANQGSPELPKGPSPGATTPKSTTIRPVWAGKHLLVRVPEIGSASSPDVESGSSWFWYWADSMHLDSVALRQASTTTLPGLVGTTGTGVVRFARLDPGERDTLRVYGGVSSPGVSANSRMVWELNGLKPSDNRWTWRTRTHENDFESYTVHYPFAPSKAAPLAFPAPMLGAFSLPVAGAGAGDSMIAVVGGVGVRILSLDDGILRDSATSRDTWYVPSTQRAVVGLAAWKPSSVPNVLSPLDLSGSPRAEMVVVAPDSFLDIASEYAAFRSNSRRLRPMATKIVRTEDLWMLFGNGSQDPLAIRDLLRRAVSGWGTSHVLLLGGGHFDPRGVTGAAPAPIPVWEDLDVATDAVLTYLDPQEMARYTVRTQDVALGRIPARTRGELAAWFQKQRVWEDPDRATSGPWRNTILAAADDMQIRVGGGSPDPIYQPDGFMGHTNASERIVGTILQSRPWAQLRKVYEVEYPANGVLEKPDAQRALIDQLNRGVAAMQYMGHGGYDILADERLLDTRSALAGLNNSSTPYIFYAGSCTVGRHDMAVNRGLSEALLVASGKGTIASISGTRPSFPDDNERLAKSFWTHALTSRSGTPVTLGEAFQMAQNSFSSSASDQQALYPNSSIYNLLGDPAMVPFPAGSPLALDNPPDSVAALDAYDIRGRGEGDVQVSLLDQSSKQVATYQYGDQTYQQTYVVPGRTLVAVRARTSNGAFSAHLLTPARIPFGDTASLVVYGWNPATLRDSAVRDTQILLTGVGSNPPSDLQGPRIRILPCDSSWTAGQPFGAVAEVPLPFCLNIFFDDSSGISSSDAPDEGVILSVPGTLDPWHPSQIQEGADFTQAWTRLSLDATTFQTGKTYPIKVFARDLMGNASSATLELHTRKPGEVDLYEVFNRPNPAKGASTTFYFKLLADADSNGTIPGSVQASIRIHTISGKLVRILHTDLTEVGNPRPRAVWNLQDAFRNDVANGLYPYTILLRVKDTDGGNWRQIEKRGIIAVSR